jgi:uncharacterized membrane protein
MQKFFSNLNYVLAAGVVFLLVVMGLAHAFHNELALLVFLHVICGIMWIGHLYYFNFTQIPTMPKIPADLKPAVSKHIAPAALFWFRWGAAATVLTGGIVAYRKHYLLDALSFAPGYSVIGLGMWLALIMAANVWFIIWPNQKKALGIVEASAEAKAKAATTAMMFSRTNTLLSIPMLYCMVGQSLGVMNLG